MKCGRKTLFAVQMIVTMGFVAQTAWCQDTVSLADATLKGNEKIATPYGEVRLEDNYITDDSSKKLFDAMDTQRAAQAYIWSTPLVSFTTWRDQQNLLYGPNARGTFAVFVSYNEKLGIVTGNLTTPYIIGFDSLSKGPIYVDYPAGKTAGGFLDFWQRPITDLGLTGPIRAKAGSTLSSGQRTIRQSTRNLASMFSSQPRTMSFWDFDSLKLIQGSRTNSNQS